MLSVYDLDFYKRKYKREPIRDNEKWFMEHLNQIKMDDTAKKLASEIDGIEFISDTKFKNIAGDVTDIKFLSTSAKAVLNVYFFPEIVFDFTFCRSIAKTIGFSIKRGRIALYLYEKEAPYAMGFDNEKEYNRQNNIRVVTGYGTRRCETVYQAYHYLTWYVSETWYDPFEEVNEWNLKKHARSEWDSSFYMDILTFSKFEYAAFIRYCSHDYISSDFPIYPGYKPRGQGYVIGCGDDPVKEKQAEERRKRKEKYGNPISDKRLYLKYIKEISRREKAQAGFDQEALRKIKERKRRLPTTMELIRWLQEFILEEQAKVAAGNGSKSVSGIQYIGLGLTGAYIRGDYDRYSEIEIVYQVKELVVKEAILAVIKAIEEGNMEDGWKRNRYSSVKEDAERIVKGTYERLLGNLIMRLQNEYHKIVSMEEYKAYRREEKKEPRLGSSCIGFKKTKESKKLEIEMKRNLLKRVYQMEHETLWL